MRTSTCAVCTRPPFFVGGLGTRLYQPMTDVSIRQQSLNSYRLILASQLIGSYNTHQRYNIPAAIKEASCSLARKRPQKEVRVESDGHFPIKGTRGRCVHCWNVLGQRHETNVRCRKCGKALCLESRDCSGSSCFEVHHLHKL